MVHIFSTFRISNTFITKAIRTRAVLYGWRGLGIREALIPVAQLLSESHRARDVVVKVRLDYLRRETPAIEGQGETFSRNPIL